MDRLEYIKSEKERLEQLSEGLKDPNKREEILKLLNQEIGENTEDSKDKSNNLSKGGKSFTLSIPGRGGLFERDENQKGFSRPIMLGIISLICETLFIVTSYLLFN